MSINTDPSASVPLSSGQGSANEPDDFGKGAEGKFKRWQAELNTSKRDRHNWGERAAKVLRRYKDERDAIDQSDRLFNVLWSNVQVMKPAIYAKPPKPEVSRKFDTTNQVQRVAALMMERNLDTFVCEHSLFDSTLNACVLDRLLPGQGTAWIRYDAVLPPAPMHPEGEEPAPTASPQVYNEHEATETPLQESNEHANQQVTEDAYQIPTGESVCFDYVHWKDFRCNPARTWEEVTWVARRVFMDKTQGKKRFGSKFDKVPLNYKEDSQKGTGVNREFGPGMTTIAKAAIWEIWDKSSKTVIWLCEDYSSLLDEKRDLLELTDFFPCPKPLLATTTTDSIIPIPDYCLYQDQAKELDQATNRISLLMQALKVIGVYDKTQEGVQRLLTEGVDNIMIPVDNWAMFAERGGLKGVVDFFPVEMVGQVLSQLIQDRNVIKQDIYEITGIADIVRGSTVASETATAQDLKAKFAGIRINDSQKDIARFAADLLNMAAEIITNFFQPESILLNANIEQGDSDFQYVPQAIQLIKDRKLIQHRMSVSVDAITNPDKKEEQAARVEFLTALGQFFQQAGTLVQSQPALAPMMGHVLLWGVRGFSVGRDLEGVIEQGIKTLTEKGPAEPPPDPAAEKAKAEMEMMQAEGQMRAQEGQQKMQMEQQKAQLEVQKMQQEMQIAQQEMQTKLQFMQQEFQMKMAQMQQEFQFRMQQLQQEGQIKLQLAQQTNQIKVEAAQTDAAIKAETAETDAQLQAAAGAQELEQQAESHEQTMEQQAEAAALAAKTKPKGESK